MTQMAFSNHGRFDRIRKCRALKLTIAFAVLFSQRIPVMSQYLVDRGFAALSLITMLLLCDCSSPNLAIESNPMPEK
ncbi:MAG TPA: hypothetical protein VNN24_08520, partial [Candidatus Binatus sp.]|nr:hypothetical protein [Candidatus Binatus sp.]